MYAWKTDGRWQPDSKNERFFAVQDNLANTKKLKFESDAAKIPKY